MLWLLANLLVRSTIILGTAGLLCRFVKGLRPAQRHGILLAAFVLLLLWPLLASVLPEIAIPLGLRASKSMVARQQITVTSQILTGKEEIVVSPALLWASAMVMALWPLAGAHFRLRSLLRRAVPITDAEWIGLLDELSQQFQLSSTPTLLSHPEPLMPMTCGWRKARILLPGDCPEWTAARRRIVLLHELAHIARRDLLAQCCARLAAACWWFQPLSWTTLHWLRRESERSCDELVIASGVRPSDYATELLAIAQTFASHQRVPAVAIGVAHQNGLESRLRSILQLQTARSTRSASPLFAGLALLAALTFTASQSQYPPHHNDCHQEVTL